MITYNYDDGIYYGTFADRITSNISGYEKTAIFYEYDTKTYYITDGTTWWEYATNI